MKALFPLSSLALGIGALLVCSSAAQAHHPIKAKFDPARESVIRGIVTEVDWRNPHAHVFVNVDNGGVLQNWAVELESPVILHKNGWNEDTLRPGDSIEVSGILARNDTRQIWGESVVATATGRQVYTADNAAPALPLAPRPAPRWPDGSVALGTVTGGTDGYWSFPSATVLSEQGANVSFDSDGLLLKLDDASKVAPLQPWALGLYKHRQERMLQDDPMYLNCKPPGGPRQYQSDLGLQFLEDKANQRIFVLLGSGNHNYRIIHLDGDGTGLVGGDDDNPLYYGRSVAHWDGDTLVAETRGFNEDFWFSNGGLPHTDQLVMEERFTRPDADTLKYEVTINDPGAYTRPWSTSWTMQWVGGEDLPQYFCQNNRQ